MVAPAKWPVIPIPVEPFSARFDVRISEPDSGHGSLLPCSFSHWKWQSSCSLKYYLDLISLFPCSTALKSIGLAFSMYFRDEECLLFQKVGNHWSHSPELQSFLFLSLLNTLF